MGAHLDLAFPPLPEDADEATRLAHQAWAHITRVFIGQQTRRQEVAAELGLDAGDLISLFHLLPGAGVSQRELAEEWACDPSWVTNRIDRLEHLGLVERRVSATDRRVKEVWLTAAGDHARAAGLLGFTRPPATITALGTPDLGELVRLLGEVDPDPELAAASTAPTPADAVAAGTVGADGPTS